MLADFYPRPKTLVVDSQGEELVLDLSFSCALVDAPLVGGG